MTPHPLQLEMARLRRRAILLAWTQAAAKWIACAAATALLWALADYWLRLEDAALRMVGPIAVIAVERRSRG